MLTARLATNNVKKYHVVLILAGRIYLVNTVREENTFFPLFE